MAKPPDDMVQRILREIQSTLAEHTRLLEDQTERFGRIEKQFADLGRVVTYSLGQSTEAKFRQSQQESRIDELFEQLEKLLSDEQPVERIGEWPCDRGIRPGHVAKPSCPMRHRPASPPSTTRA